MSAAVYRGAYETASPMLIDPTGNNRTLDHEGIHREVKKFYDMYYDKSCIVLVSYGNSTDADINKVEKMLENFDEDSEMGSFQELPEVKHYWILPELNADYYIFMNSTESPKLTHYVYVKLGITQSQEFKFVSRILNDTLYRELVVRNQYAEDVDVSYEAFEEGSYLEISADLNEVGKSRLPEVFKSLHQAIIMMYKYNNQADYSSWSDAIKAEIFMKKLEGDELDIIGILTENFAKYGKKDSFVGGEVQTEYRPKIINSLIDMMVESSRISVYNGPLPDQRFSNEEEVASFYFGSTKVEPKVFPEFIRNKMSFNFTGKGRQYNFPFFSFSLSREMNLRLLILGSPQVTRLEKVNPAPLVPSPSFLNSLLRYEPSRELYNRDISDVCASCSYVCNGNHMEKMLNVFVNIHPNMKPTKEAFMWMKYYTEILNRRVSLVSRDVQLYGSKFEFFIDEFGINLHMGIVSEDPLGLVGRALKAAINQDVVGIDEHWYAVERIDFIDEDDKDLYWRNEVMMNTTLYDYMPSDADLSEFKSKLIHQEIDRPAEVPELFRSWVHVEEAVPETDLKGLMKELSVLKEAENPLNSVESVELKENEVLLVREDLEKEEESDSKAYLSCHLLGKVSARLLAYKTLLDQFAYNWAYQYLREEKRIGYVVGAKTSLSKRDMYFCLYSQSDKEVSYVEETMESFYPQLERMIGDLGEEELEREKKNQEANVADQYLDSESEAKHWYTMAMRGLGADLTEEVVDEIRKVTKESFMEVYRDAIKEGSKRLIRESLPKDKLNEPHIDAAKLYNPGSKIVAIIIN